MVLVMIRLLQSHYHRAEQPRNICISGLSTSHRRVAATETTIGKAKSKVQVHHGTIELDSHADTIVFGKNFLKLSDTGRVCTVSPYTDTYESIESVPIVTAATAWTSPNTGETIILVFNEGLWMADRMSSSLINPNQLRNYGVVVQDNPYSESPLYIMSHDDDFVLPLSLDGTNVMANTRTPNQQELGTCRHVTLSSPHTWDPQNIRFPKPSRSVEEEIMWQGERRIGGLSTHFADEFTEADAGDSEDESGVFAPSYNLDAMQRRLIGSVKVYDVPQTATVASAETQDVPTIPTFQSKKRHTDVTPQDLSERWCISIKQAFETLKRTTQRIVRSAIMPLGRRYKADRMFFKRTLKGEWFTDTLDGRVMSREGNRYAQVFANKNYFPAVYPMDTKGKAGEALREFCREFGVPEKLTFDGSQEQNGRKTEFMKQVRKMI